MSDDQRYPRRFYLFRGEDETGVSGTGVVADGVVWQDGTVTIKWLGDHSSEVSWKGMADVEHVHGHGGRTVPIWRDDENGKPFHDQTDCPWGPVEIAPGLQMPRHWVEEGIRRGVADVEAGRVKQLPEVTD